MKHGKHWPVSRDSNDNHNSIVTLTPQKYEKKQFTVRL